MNDKESNIDKLFNRLFRKHEEASAKGKDWNAFEKMLDKEIPPGSSLPHSIPNKWFWGIGGFVAVVSVTTILLLNQHPESESSLSEDNPTQQNIETPQIKVNDVQKENSSIIQNDDASTEEQLETNGNPENVTSSTDLKISQSSPFGQSKQNQRSNLNQNIQEFIDIEKDAHTGIIDRIPQNDIVTNVDEISSDGEKITNEEQIEIIEGSDDVSNTTSNSEIVSQDPINTNEVLTNNNGIENNILDNESQQNDDPSLVDEGEVIELDHEIDQPIIQTNNDDNISNDIDKTELNRGNNIGLVDSTSALEDELILEDNVNDETKNDVVLVDSTSLPATFDTASSTVLEGTATKDDKFTKGRSLSLHVGMSAGRGMHYLTGGNFTRIGKHAINPTFGFTYSTLLDDKLWASLGIHYNRIGGNVLSHSSTLTSYFLIEETKTTTVSVYAIEYIHIPLIINYTLAPKVSLEGGIFAGYLLNTVASVSDSTIMGSNISIEPLGKVKGYMSGLAEYRIGFTLGAQYQLHERLNAGIRYHKSINDITDDTFWGVSNHQSPGNIEVFLKAKLF